ncbi:MAG: KpsF/GutQ family sugar-phosphate isomerase [Bacteriovoracaceae bacterium]|nr:KpsF/GutQ family sugar-phosphate isomerase [Bacteriovoracaceae bacterium]
MGHLSLVKDVLRDEARAIERIIGSLTDENIEKVANVFRDLKSTGGSLIITGVGKSGNIAQKIASTFSSLGLPSFFLHPIEALHGDLGRVTSQDAVIILSKSGSTEEILKLLPYLCIPKEKAIAILGNTDSPIAQRCGIIFDCSVEKEACMHNQAPTTSSTVALAMGDALAVLYESVIGVTKEKFARNHPGGLLGKTLSLKVSDMLIAKDDCPSVTANQTLKDAIIAMTKKPIGMCAVLDGDTLKGIIVEGDVRRSLTKDDNAISFKISDIMNAKPIVGDTNMLAYEALQLMESGQRAVSVLPIVESKKFLGAIRLHDLLKMGFVSSKK